MLNTSLTTNTATFSGITLDHIPFADNLSNTTHSSTTHGLSTDSPVHYTPAYQIALTPVQGAKGVKHQLVLKENTFPAAQVQESDTLGSKRRSSRVALRGRTKFSRNHSIIQKPPPQQARKQPTKKTIRNSRGVEITTSSEHRQNSNLRKADTGGLREKSRDFNEMPVQIPDSQLVPEVAAAMSEADLGMTFDENEKKIVDATIQAFQTGTLMPLIKEELRCTIQSRRLAAGKGELKVEFKRPPKKKEMSEDERKRAGKRRIQNREAAQRFRQRQKDTSDFLSDKIDRLQKNSEALILDLESLRKERDELQDMLHSHLRICTRTSQDTRQGTEHFNVDELFARNGNATTSADCASCEPVASLSHAHNEISVVYADDISSSVVIVPDGELSQMLESSGGFCYAEEDFISNPDCEDKPFTEYEKMLPHDDSPLPDITVTPDFCSKFLEVPHEVYADEPPEACYEEVVMDTMVTDFERERLNSCSSVDTHTTFDSFISEAQSLSESMSDFNQSLSESTCGVRQSLHSAYSRVHMDSVSSEPFELRFMDHQDFLLADEDISS